MAPASRAALSLLLLLATGVDAAPFPTRDQNPLIADFGLPQPLPARVAPDGDWSFGSSFNWSSSAIVQSAATEALVADVETRELRIVIGRRLGERLALQAQLPYRYVGPGILDSFIDDWHDVFGLSQGMRPWLPQDHYRILYERDGRRILDERSSSSGIANLSLDAALQVLSTEHTDVAVWVSLKLPTSTLDLPGHDTTDAALSLVAAHRLSPRWSVFGQASLALLGDDERLSGEQERAVWSGHVGTSVRAWRGLSLTLQLDEHSAVFEDSQLDYLGDALAVTFGGSYELESGWRLDIGISEDLSVDASPDVVFVLGVQKGPARSR